jgi:hypothetical protein
MIDVGIAADNKNFQELLQASYQTDCFATRFKEYI